MNTEQLIEGLSKESLCQKTASSPARIFLRWMLVSLLAAAGMLLVFGLRSDLSEKLHDGFFLAEIATLALVMLSMAFAAAILSFPDIYQRKYFLWVLPASLFAFVISLLFAYLEKSAAPLPEHSWICLFCITMFSLAPAAWFFVLLRRQASTHPQMAGSAAMLAAVSIGALTLRLSEQTDSLEHLLVWHYLPMVGYMLIGAWAGKRFFKW